MNTSFFLIFGALAVIILLVVMSLGSKNDKQLEKRMKKASKGRAQKLDKTRAKSKRKSMLQRDTKKTKLDDYLEVLGTSRSSSRSKLVQAGLDMNVITFLFIRLIAGGLVFAIIFTTNLMPLLYAVAVSVAIAIILPSLYLRKRIFKRSLAFEKILPDALDLMERGLKTGMPISKTIKNVGENIENPVGEEFRRMYTDIKFGVPLEKAIWSVADRIPTQEYNFFAVSVALQSETGGNLAENLSRLGEVLRNRMEIRRMIKSKSAEARWSGRVIAALPFVFVGLVWVMSREFLNPLFYDPRGTKMLIIALVMIAMGILSMRKLTRFDF